jgi:hypothetical protein
MEENLPKQDTEDAMDFIVANLLTLHPIVSSPEGCAHPFLDDQARVDIEQPRSLTTAL